MQKPLKTIRINPESYVRLEKMKDSFNRPIKQLVEELIQYAYKLRIDPSNVKDGNPAAATEKLRKDLIAFTKTQENKMIKPMIESVGLTVNKINSIADTVPNKETIDSQHSKTVVIINKIIGGLKTVNSNVNEIQKMHLSFQKEKENFKSLAIQYLKEYMNQREQLNSITHGKKIDEVKDLYIKKFENI